MVLDINKTGFLLDFVEIRHRTNLDPGNSNCDINICSTVSTEVSLNRYKYDI